MANIQVENPPDQEICEHVAFDKTGKTYQVTLCTGEVGAVENVTGVHVTGEKVILVRGDDAPAVFRRQDVYFVTCHDCLPPAMA